MMFQRLRMPHDRPYAVTNGKEMIEDTKEVREKQTSLSVRKEFEKGSVTSAGEVSIRTGENIKQGEGDSGVIVPSFHHAQVTSADEVSIRTGENIKQGEGDSHSMRAESMIGKDGGMLEIPNTGVSLKIPPGALQRAYSIQMGIIPHHYLDETVSSFASNSSVMVELLPNNVKLVKPATLTLPHCLVLKKNCKRKAKVYSSHHKEGTRPQWEEEENNQCDVTYETCVMRLYNFSWKKVQIGDQIVEAKKIVLFADKGSLSTKNVTYLDIGYYWQLASCQQVLKMNRVIVKKEMQAVFYKEGQLPLAVLFGKVVPPNWTYNEAKNKKMAPDETDQCTCYFKAGQGSDLVELIFPLMMDFILPGRVSAKSSSLKPISEETNKTVEQQEDKNNDVPSKGKNLPLPSHQAIRRKAEENPTGAEATTSDSEEVTDETLLVVLELLGNLFKEWRDVGRKLKLDETDLDNIEAENRRKGYKEVVYQMLLLWKRKYGMKATHKTLKDALKAAYRKDLSDYLLNREQCGATSDLYPEKALSVQSVVSEEGRILKIPGTGVRLDIPPGAIDGKRLIQMKIIPNYIQEESFFTSNTTVVVELLPDNLKLHHRAKLTLPHCLKLKNPAECKVRVLSSHHVQGTQPMWIPKKNALYQLNETNCIIWVESFSWETCRIDDKDVELKKIQVYAACSQLDPPTKYIHMELGYYIDLPGKKEIIEKNDLKILQEKPFHFYKEGKLPLKILLNKIRPESWKCIEDTNLKEIPFMEIASSIEYSCPFCFDKVGEKDCTFYFKATQKETIELRVPYKKVLAASHSGSSAQLVNVQPSKNRHNESTSADTDTNMMRLAASHSSSLSLSLTRDVQLSQQTRCDESSQVKDVTLRESSLSRNEAAIPLIGNATAGDTHEELPSAIVQTEDPNVSEESLQMMLRRPRRPSSKHIVVTNVKEMKEDAKEFGENKRRLLGKRKFEEGSVTSADDLSIRKSENIKKDEGDSHSMRAESMIGKDGGTLDIQNTGVSLEIPPGALRREYFIRMRIIPHHYLDGTELSFASNSSVVVELLPNNVLLLKPATLTLPHCLVLKKRCEWKATVYRSHHKEGTRPQWEEEINTQCVLTYQNCVMRLNNFCWIKFTIDGEIVVAKRIVLFATQRFSSTKYVTFLDVGYYWQLPGCREKVLKLNDATSLHEKPAVFYKKGQMPLTVLFEKVEPPIWRYKIGNKEKVIKFNTVAITKGSFCTFNLNKMDSDETDGCECFIKAGQGSDLEELMFSLKESSLSRAEAIIPSTGNGTAGDSQEELPSAISQTIVCDKILQELKIKIGTYWRDVGRKLNLTDDKLDNLIITCRNLKHEEMVYQMLLKWKRENARAATYYVLADACKRAGRADLELWVLGRLQAYMS